jgi:hypothetical protein
MKTKREIIKETSTFYNSCNRASDENGTCVYINRETNAMCAVGRCMTEEAIKKYGSFEGTAFRFDEYLKIHITGSIIGLDAVLKEEYQGHSYEFWGDLQKLHDGDIIGTPRA